MGSGGGGNSVTSASPYAPWLQGYLTELADNAASYAYGGRQGEPFGFDQVADDYMARTAPRFEQFDPYQTAAQDASAGMFDRGDLLTGRTMGAADAALGGLSSMQAVSPTYGASQFNFGSSMDALGALSETPSMGMTPYGGDIPTYGVTPEFGRTPEVGLTPRLGQTPQVGMTPDMGRTPEVGMTPQFQGSLDDYMNPYFQSVVNQQIDAANEQFLKDQSLSDAQRVASGARGGYREAVDQAVARAQNQKLISDIQAQGSEAAFRDAQERMFRDRARGEDIFERDRTNVQNIFDRDRANMQGVFQADRANLQDVFRQDRAAEQAAFQADRANIQDIFDRDRANAQSAFQADRQNFQDIFDRNRANRQGIFQADRANLQDVFGRDRGFMQDLFERDRAAGIRGAEMSDDSAYRAAQMDFDAQGQNVANTLRQAQAYTDMSRFFDDLDTRMQDRERARISGMADAGGQRQALGQALRDLSFDEYMREFMYPQEQMRFLSGILAGVPTQANAYVRTPGPGLFQQGVGAATALGGLALAGRDR